MTRPTPRTIAILHRTSISASYPAPRSRPPSVDALMTDILTMTSTKLSRDLESAIWALVR
jgi:hypothetical protein